jgi:hypothetical protein
LWSRGGSTISGPLEVLLSFLDVLVDLVLYFWGNRIVLQIQNLPSPILEVLQIQDSEQFLALSQN